MKNSRKLRKNCDELGGMGTCLKKIHVSQSLKISPVTYYFFLKIRFFSSKITTFLDFFLKVRSFSSKITTFYLYDIKKITPPPISKLSV